MLHRTGKESVYLVFVLQFLQLAAGRVEHVEVAGDGHGAGNPYEHPQKDVVQQLVLGSVRVLLVAVALVRVVHAVEVVVVVLASADEPLAVAFAGRAVVVRFVRAALLVAVVFAVDLQVTPLWRLHSCGSVLSLAVIRVPRTVLNETSV